MLSILFAPAGSGKSYNVSRYADFLVDADDIISAHRAWPPDGKWTREVHVAHAVLLLKHAVDNPDKVILTNADVLHTMRAFSPRVGAGIVIPLLTHLAQLDKRREDEPWRRVRTEEDTFNNRRRVTTACLTLRMTIYTDWYTVIADIRQERGR